MMTRMFEPQLGKSIEIYVDDMVVKSKVVYEHLGDLGNTFGVLRKHKLRLNASKCSFGMGSGKFLGYMVTHRGIEVNLDQIKAINDLKPPQNAKEVQKFTGMITALNRFISRSADRCSTRTVLWPSGNSRNTYPSHLAGESHTSCGPCYVKASPLFPSPHSDCSNPTTLKVRTSDR